MARTTMADLLLRLRGLTQSGTADYAVSGTTYWTDDQLQDVLDRNRMDVIDERLQPHSETNSGGTVVYYLYQSGYRNLEATDGGTAVFYMRDSSGSRAGTANYAVDYNAGRVVFNVDTAGTVFYLTARTFDLNAAAAEVWDQKASSVAERFDFSADGASFKVSQLTENYRKQAAYYRSLASFGAGVGMNSSTMYRDDVVLTWFGHDFVDRD